MVRPPPRSCGEVADVDGEGVGARVEGVAPHPVEDHVAGQHLTGVAQEQLEQVELDAGKGEVPLATGRLGGGQVEREVTDRSRLALAPGPSSEQGAEACQQLARAKGFTR